MPSMSQRMFWAGMYVDYVACGIDLDTLFP